jgi:acetyl-CoA C-acetyltransferase
MGGLGGKVAIIGTGTIKFGENFHQSLSDMIFEAVNLAMADARIESSQLQAAWLGCYEPMLYGFEGNSGTFVSDPLNLFPIPVTRVAAYCATGIEAVRNAALAVASGEYDLVLAVGAEKMREVPSRLRGPSGEPGHPVLAKGGPRRACSRFSRPSSRSTGRVSKRSAQWRRRTTPRLPQPQGALPEGDHRRDAREGAQGRRAARALRLLPDH